MENEDQQEPQEATRFIIIDAKTHAIEVVERVCAAVEKDTGTPVNQNTKALFIYMYHTGFQTALFNNRAFMEVLEKATEYGRKMISEPLNLETVQTTKSIG